MRLVDVEAVRVRVRVRVHRHHARDEISPSLDPSVSAGALRS